MPSSQPPQPLDDLRPSLAAVAFAWAGAGLFVVSLLYFLYAYLVLFDVAATRRGALDAIVSDLALFAAFAGHHSVFARMRVKHWLRRRLAAPAERSLFTWVASAMFLLVCWAWQPVPGEVYTIQGPWRWLFHGAQGLGVGLAILGSRAVDVLDLGGVRPVLDARARRFGDRHVPLVVTGVYRIVRHPIYFGWVLLVFGHPDMNATRLTFAAISTAYLAVAIPLEERGLAAAFGPAYRLYSERVRWKMIPGVY